MQAKLTYAILFVCSFGHPSARAETVDFMQLLVGAKDKCPSVIINPGTYKMCHACSRELVLTGRSTFRNSHPLGIWLDDCKRHVHPDTVRAEQFGRSDSRIAGFQKQTNYNIRCFVRVPAACRRKECGFEKPPTTTQSRCQSFNIGFDNEVFRSTYNKSNSQELRNAMELVRSLYRFRNKIPANNEDIIGQWLSHVDIGGQDINKRIIATTVAVYKSPSHLSINYILSNIAKVRLASKYRVLGNIIWNNNRVQLAACHRGRKVRLLFDHQGNLKESERIGRCAPSLKQ